MAQAVAALTTLRVVVAEDDCELRETIREALGDRGHRVVGEAGKGADMVRIVLAEEPDVVVFDVHLPGFNGLEALRQIYEEQPVAAVALTEQRDQPIIRTVLEDFDLTYLVKPVQAHQLEPAVLVAYARFDKDRQLISENATLRRNLENRKIIERAKGVLMRRYRWSEAEGYRRLQRGAMNNRTTMVELAQAVLNGVEVNL
jgi:response regulator NasT